MWWMARRPKGEGQVKTIVQLGLIATVLLSLGLVMILPVLALIGLGTWIVYLVLGS